jgi:hypothetical protein
MGGSAYSTDTTKDAQFKRATRGMIIEVRPYVLSEALPESFTIKPEDRASGSPTAGDMTARDPHNKTNQWLIAKAEFDFYMLIDTAAPTPPSAG